MNTAEWRGRPWPPPPPPLPKRRQQQQEQHQEASFRKEASQDRPFERFDSQPLKAKPKANKRRRRPVDPQTGRYKRSNKRSEQGVRKRELKKELRKRIRGLRNEVADKDTKQSSSKDTPTKGQVQKSIREEHPQHQTQSHPTSSDSDTSGSETVESSSSISVIPPASSRGGRKA